MSHPKNSAVVRGALKSLCTVAGRRSSEKFANNVISAIIKTLERKYVFLKYVKIDEKNSTDFIVVSYIFVIKIRDRVLIWNSILGEK